MKYNFIYKPGVIDYSPQNDTLFVDAELCYRKFNQFFLNRFFSEDGKTNITAPITVLSREQKKIIIKRPHDGHP